MTQQSEIGKALNWSAIDTVVQFVASFIVMIVLARMLAPEDFGLMAMLALFITVAGIFVDSGFSQALIQRQTITSVDESTLFFFTIAIGTIISILLCMTAPWIAEFYEQPLLEMLTYWMALNLWINTFSTIHSTLLTKKLDFKTTTKVGTVASIISGVLAVVMALQGWGVWSLVGQVLSATIVRVILFWWLHSWRPTMEFSFNALRSLFSFGGFLLWTGLLNAIYLNLYGLLIGKFHSAQDAGFYVQASRIQKLPANLLGNTVGRVVFPVFSTLADDKDRFVRAMRRALVALMFINFPIMLGMMYAAEPLILLLLGGKWLPMVPVFQALIVVGLMFPLQMLNINALKSLGKSVLIARIQIIKLLVAISLLLFTSPYGILMVAYGQVIATIFAFFVNTHCSKMLLNYGWKEQLRDIAPYFFITIVLMLLCWGCTIVFNLSDQVRLVLVVLFGISYILSCKLAKLSAFNDVFNIIRRK